MKDSEEVSAKVLVTKLVMKNKEEPIILACMINWMMLRWGRAGWKWKIVVSVWNI